MANFAKVDKASNMVTETIIADAEFIAELDGYWLEFSEDGSIRNYAPGIGDFYDPELDEFYGKPMGTYYQSWVWDRVTKRYIPPIARPADSQISSDPNSFAHGKRWIWDEETFSWVDESDVVYIDPNTNTAISYTDLNPELK